MLPATKLERRVVAAAEEALTSRRYVSPLDVLTGIGWVPAGLVTDWRQGWAPHLEAVAAVSADRLVDALMSGVPRDDARARIRSDVDRVLDGWRRPAHRPRS